VKKLLALAFVLFLFAVIYWADSGRMPSLFESVYRYPHGDKVGHFVLYGILAWLLNAAFPGRRISLGRISLPLGMFSALLFALLEELSQFFFPNRTPDWADLLWGWLGILAATLIAADDPRESSQRK
jgi:VanZ family protein